MIKRILVPLDPSPFTDSALEIATMMARIKIHIHNREITNKKL